MSIPIADAIAQVSDADLGGFHLSLIDPTPIDDPDMVAKSYGNMSDLQSATIISSKTRWSNQMTGIRSLAEHLYNAGVDTRIYASGLPIAAPYVLQSA